MIQKRTLLLLSLLVLPLYFVLLDGNFSEARINSEKQSEPFSIKQTAPDFTVQDVDSGGTNSLSDFLGKIVILDLFATWCTPCQLSLPFLRELYSKYSANDIQIISVDVDNSESESVVSQFRVDEGMDWIVSLDPGGSINSAYGTGSIPTFYIIDKEGIIQWSDTGFTNEITKPAMEDMIESLLQENPNNGNTDPTTTSRVFLVILEVSAGLAGTGAVIFGVYKLRQRFGVKKCLKCSSVASSKCAKCGMLTCTNCSSRGCSNCGSRQFVRL